MEIILPFLPFIVIFQILNKTQVLRIVLAKNTPFKGLLYVVNFTYLRSQLNVLRNVVELMNFDALAHLLLLTGYIQILDGLFA